jgi:hypothetical protein
MPVRMMSPWITMPLAMGSSDRPRIGESTTHRRGSRAGIGRAAERLAGEQPGDRVQHLAAGDARARAASKHVAIARQNGTARRSV